MLQSMLSLKKWWACKKPPLADWSVYHWWKIKPQCKVFIHQQYTQSIIRSSSFLIFYFHLKATLTLYCRGVKHAARGPRPACQRVQCGPLDGHGKQQRRKAASPSPCWETLSLLGVLTWVKAHTVESCTTNTTTLLQSSSAPSGPRDAPALPLISMTNLSVILWTRRSPKLS